MKNPLLNASIILVIFILHSCTISKDESVSSIVKPGIVLISGEIENYDGTIKTGNVVRFDVITRISNNEIFQIDSTGKFMVSFELLMPTNTNLIRIGNTVSYLYLIPGEDYKLSIEESGRYRLEGGSYLKNDQFRALSQEIYKRFQKSDRMRNQHMADYSYSYDDLCTFLKDVALNKINFIENYCDSNEVSKEIKELFLNEAEYDQAWARILYRMIYHEDGRVEFRQDLPNNFYSDLFSEFPINNPAASASRKYMDYMSNLQSSFIEQSRSDQNNYFDYLQQNTNYTEIEVNFILGSVSHDTSITNTEAYKTFWSEHRGEIGELNRKYYMDYILDTLVNFPSGYGRDILLSQSVGRLSFDGAYLPLDESSWDKLEALIEHEVILTQLKRLDRLYKAKSEQGIDNSTTMRDPLLAQNSKEFYSNLIEKYAGKYIYVDFWATWCGPCKDEMPFSKILYNKYHEEDIVFLYLCCASGKEAWEQYIKSEQLSGEHYFINNDELNYLSEYFDIGGYPTYAIINPEGKVIDNFPPRPSSPEIMNFIDNLLKKTVEPLQ